MYALTLLKSLESIVLTFKNDNWRVLMIHSGHFITGQAVQTTTHLRCCVTGIDYERSPIRIVPVVTLHTVAPAHGVFDSGPIQVEPGGLVILSLSPILSLRRLNYWKWFSGWVLSCGHLISYPSCDQCRNKTHRVRG